MNDRMDGPKNRPNPLLQQYPVDIDHVLGLLAQIPDGVVSLETQQQLLQDTSYSNFWSSLGQSQRDALSSCVVAGTLEKQLLVDIFELEAGPTLDFTQGLSQRLVQGGLKGVDSVIQSLGPDARVNNYVWGMLREDNNFNLWYAFASGRAVSNPDINRISSGGLCLEQLRAFIEESGKGLTLTASR